MAVYLELRSAMVKGPAVVPYVLCSSPTDVVFFPFFFKAKSLID